MPAEAIKVAVRVRPFNQREKDLKSKLVVKIGGSAPGGESSLLQRAGTSPQHLWQLEVEAFLARKSRFLSLRALRSSR